METKTSPPRLVSLYFAACRGLSRFCSVLGASFTGLWLGTLRRKELHALDEAYYDQQEEYRTLEYNQRGLSEWERRVVEEHFASCRKLLVAAAGGGREVLALRRLGFEADGFECNSRLVQFANDMLESEGFPQSIRLAPRDECADCEELYDGVIVGWGAYTHIRGRDRRIAFLRELRSRTEGEASILLSFFHLNAGFRRFRMTAVFGSAVARLLGREKVEVGDYLLPEFVHYFTRDDIASELKEAGFDMLFFATEGYAHAVGIASSIDPNRHRRRSHSREGLTWGDRSPMINSNFQAGIPGGESHGAETTS